MLNVTIQVNQEPPLNFVEIRREIDGPDGVHWYTATLWQAEHLIPMKVVKVQHAYNDPAWMLVKKVMEKL